MLRWMFLLPCLNVQPDIFAVTNCCIVALGVFSSDSLTWSSNSLYSVHGHIKWEEWMYRKMCILCQQTSPKRWFGNKTMTSNCDVTNSAHQIQMTTLRHWKKPPHEKFLRTPLFHAIFPLKRLPAVSQLRLPCMRFLQGHFKSTCCMYMLFGPSFNQFLCFSERRDTITIKAFSSFCINCYKQSSGKGVGS